MSWRSITAHLAFAALLFPLLVKKLLKDAGLFTMDDWDWERLRRLDWYLTHNPFAPRDRRAQHPWHRVENEALVAARAEQFYTHMSSALDRMSATPEGGNSATP